MAATPVDTRKINLVEIIPGLTIEVREPTPGQIIVVSKAAAAAVRDSGKELDCIDILFRVTQKLLVNPEDAARLDEGLIDETISPSDLMAAIFQTDEDQKDAAPPKARTRRGR